MTDPTPGPAGPSDASGSGSGAVSERMRALLSRAVDEQVQEQRAVSTVLQELRGQVATLGEALSRTASGAGVERVAADLGALAGDLRASSTSLAGRLEAVGRRVDEQAARVSAGGQGGETTALRLAALSDEVEGTGRLVAQLGQSVEALTQFPSAVAGVQKDVAGLHDRLAPLAEVRSALEALTERTEAESLRPELQALRSQVEALPGAADLSRHRDAVVEAVAGRLERVEALAGRPVVAPEALDAAVLRLGGQLDALTEGGPVVARLEQRLTTFEERLAEVLERLAEVGTAAGGVAALSRDLSGVAAAVRDLPALRADVTAVRDEVAGLRDDGATMALSLGVAAVREDLGELAARIEASTPAPPDVVAAAVAPRVADRLVEALAPRVADVVLARLAPALVEQVAAAVNAQVLGQVTEVVRGMGVESERRVLAHVDEAVLALADALLRRRRAGRPVGEVVAPVVADPLPLVPPPPVDDSAFEAAAVPAGDQDAVGVVASPAAVPGTPDGSVDERTGEEVAGQTSEDDVVESVVDDRLTQATEPEAQAVDETATADAPQPDASQSDAPQPDAPQSDAPQPDAPQPDAPQPGAPRPGAPAAVSARQRLAAAAQQAASADFGMPEILPAEQTPSGTDGSARYDTDTTAGDSDAGDSDAGDFGAGVRGSFESGTRSPLSTLAAPPFTRQGPPRGGVIPAGQPTSDEDDDAGPRRPWWRPGG